MAPFAVAATASRSPTSTSSPSVFRTRAEKGRYIADRISRNSANAVIFYVREATRRTLAEELRRRKLASTPLSNMRELRSFCNGDGDKSGLEIVQDGDGAGMVSIDGSDIADGIDAENVEVTRK